MALAADRGFSFAEPYVLALLFAGIAVFAAIGALSHQHDRAFSASLIYLGLGLVAAVGIDVLGESWLDPLEDGVVYERASELAVVIALFATGLRLDRALRWREWSTVTRLLAVAMPVTVAAIALYGWQVMGLSLGAAIILGGALAPTDPVLAGDIGVGPPDEEDEREPNFSITGEAGLNDGLAFPFIFLGAFVAAEGGTGWLGEWLLADVLYGIGGGLAIGAALGHGIAALAVRLRDRALLSRDLDGWLGPAAALLIYGVCETAGALGFLAAFAGGLAFRRYEREHEYNVRVHRGAEMIEKFAELAVVMLVASTVTLTGLGVPGVTGWLLVPVALLAVRPVAVALSLLGARSGRRERAFVAWFGVRGIGSIYYAAVAIGFGVLSPGEAATVFWTVTACVIASIVVHGISAAPLSRRWLAPVNR